MTVRAWWIGLAFAGLLLPGGLHAEEIDADRKAKAAYKRYQAARRDDSWSGIQTRFKALRELGSLPCECSRKSLLKIARKSRNLDDRILAAQGIATHGTPETVQQLVLDLKKKCHPVLTEIVGAGLASNEDRAVHAWLAGDALQISDTGLGPVLRAHAKLGLPEAVEALAARIPDWAAGKATVGLAFDAVHALGRSKHEAGRAHVLEAAGHPHPWLRLAAADVLLLRETERDPTAVAVRALLQDDEAVVKRAIAEAIADAKAELYVPDLTHLLGDEDPRTRKTALDALKKVTGQDLGFDAGAWRRWWAKKDTPGAAKPHTVPTYHGIPLHTEHVAFILDRSGSMQWPFRANVGNRMDSARLALTTVLAELTSRTMFNLVAFDDKVHAWQKSEVKADPKTVLKATRWVSKQEAKRGAGTNTYGVLKQTLEANPTIDTIYFLSDGLPQDGDIITTEGILAAIHDWNRTRRVQIHAVSLTLKLLHPGIYPFPSYVHNAEKFMEKVAAAGRGTCKLVRKP